MRVPNPEQVSRWTRPTGSDTAGKWLRLPMPRRRNSSATGRAFDNISVTAVTAAVPEPESYAMLMAGLGVVGALARRRRRQA